MINKQKNQTEPEILSPKDRIKIFDEVEKSYTLDEAINEANRCLQCKNKPCVQGCPVNIDIPGFIAEISNKDIKKSFDILSKYNKLPAVCGRVCPQETQCQVSCVRAKNGEAVSIGRLERFVADWARKNDYRSDVLSAEKHESKVAVIGSGPAGLSAAGELASLGYDVTIFEALHVSGGVLVYGIPEFRLPKEIVKYEIEKLKDLGVKIEENVIIGNSLLFDDLKDEGFSAFFIGSGAGLPGFLGIEGEQLNGVYSANEFLTRINLFKAHSNESATPLHLGKKVAVVGAGNVAMDAARSALRAGAKEVSVIYRRTEKEMPARLEEIKHAKEEGIKFNFLVNPVKINGIDGFVSSIELEKMELGEPDESGRRRPIPINGENYIKEFDNVIISIGQKPNPLIKRFLPNLKFTKKGGVMTNEKLMTSADGVFAGGDIVSGAATVILAMGAGKTAAKAIDEYLKKGSKNG